MGGQCWSAVGDQPCAVNGQMEQGEMVNEAMIAEAATAAAVAAGAATMAVAALASDPELAKEIEQELANNPDLAAGLPNMQNLELCQLATMGRKMWKTSTPKSSLKR